MKSLVRPLLLPGSIFLLLPLLLCTCDPASRTPAAPPPSSSFPAEDTAAVRVNAAGADDIYLTTDQIRAMGIEFGNLTLVKVNGYLDATGTLGLPPSAHITLGTRTAGFLREVSNYVEGDYVRKGTLLGYLESSALIDEQQAYLETAAELSFLQQELERQEALLLADAGILKTVQRLRSEVALKSATLAGGRERLEYVGIHLTNLTPTNLTRRIPLVAPQSGYITALTMHDGLYVQPDSQLLELVKDNLLYLELNVFESGIARIEQGQRVTYRLPAFGNERFEAEVNVIGKQFNSDTKTVLVHANLSGRQPPFIQDLFVEGRIWLSDETMPALPEDAIVRDGELSYVFVTSADTTAGVGEGVSFEKLTVNPGATENGLTAVQLSEPLPAGMRIVTKGAYYVYAQAQSGKVAEE